MANDNVNDAQLYLEQTGKKKDPKTGEKLDH